MNEKEMVNPNQIEGGSKVFAIEDANARSPEFLEQMEKRERRLQNSLLSLAVPFLHYDGRHFNAGADKLLFGLVQAGSDGDR